MEEGETVGRTGGLARNGFLKSQHELGDFRLSIEVRLVRDQGNSGIQFRTKAREDGEVLRTSPPTRPPSRRCSS